MSCVPVRGCRIGEGRPKVILPIVEHTEAATGSFDGDDDSLSDGFHY